MRKSELGVIGAIIGVIVVALVIVVSPLQNNNQYISNVISFPDFYTKTQDYYVTRIGPIPAINENDYVLSITGCIDNPSSYDLSELRALPLIELPITIECIGNPTSGSLLSTANWTGFSIYNLLDSLGIKSNATGVKYYAADGYYATHTMEQLMNNTVIGALYINNQTLPPIQGYPLRIINPGYYGAKQPAWVVKIEVIDMPLRDYWDDRGWDTSPSMPIDSQIFFPETNKMVNLSHTILIGGAAYGGTRVSKVEYTLNNGLDWHQAEIFKSINADNVWVFWLITLTTTERGIITVHVKATDIYNRAQPQFDLSSNNGNNAWDSLSIEVV